MSVGAWQAAEKAARLEVRTERKVHPLMDAHATGLKSPSRRNYKETWYLLRVLLSDIISRLTSLAANITGYVLAPTAKKGEQADEDDAAESEADNFPTV